MGMYGTIKVTDYYSTLLHDTCTHADYLHRGVKGVGYCSVGTLDVPFLTSLGNDHSQSGRCCVPPRLNGLLGMKSMVRNGYGKGRLCYGEETMLRVGYA